jgi:hypothetical protein
VTPAATAGVKICELKLIPGHLNIAAATVAIRKSQMRAPETTYHRGSRAAARKI